MSTMFQALYNSVVERAKPIEAVNVDGGRFIREAKVRLMCSFFLLFSSPVCVCVCLCCCVFVTVVTLSCHSHTHEPNAAECVLARTLLKQRAISFFVCVCMNSVCFSFVSLSTHYLLVALLQAVDDFFFSKEKPDKKTPFVVSATLILNFKGL